MFTIVLHADDMIDLDNSENFHVGCYGIDVRCDW